MGKYSKPGTGPERAVNPAEQEDAFVARMLTFSEWAQKNRGGLTVGVVAAVLAVAALIYYGNYRESLNTAAAAQLEELQQRLELGDQAGAQADLQLYLERFSGTPFADEARVALAQITASMGAGRARRCRSRQARSGRHRRRPRPVRPAARGDGRRQSRTRRRGDAPGRSGSAAALNSLRHRGRTLDRTTVLAPFTLS